MISVLAIGTLVACNNEETLNMQSPYAIDFAGAFVENSTRAAQDPSTTTSTIDGFDVWAFMDARNGIILVDEDVTKNGTDWTYEQTQYWLPGHTYFFGALAPMNSDNWELNTNVGNDNLTGAGIVSFTNVDGTEDLLYASTTVETSDNLNDTYEKVALTFNHLLSKVKFTFTNGFPNDNAEIVVKNIRMTSPAEGTINLATDNAAWVPSTENITLAFGDVVCLSKGEEDECAYERLSIPATGERVYTITFDVDLFMGDRLGHEFEGLTSTVTGVALEIGKAYNFKATIDASNLGISPIEFKVEKVDEWIESNNVPSTPGQVWIKDAASMAAALTANEKSINLVLNNDIDLPISSLGTQTPGSGEYKLGGENTEYITIDLNGHTLNVTTTYWSGLGAKNNEAIFTIKNGIMTSSQTSGTWNSYDLCFANCNYVIEDVEFEKAIAFTNANKNVSLNNVTINETHDYYAIWISAKGQHVDINDLTINSDGRGIKIDEQYVSAPAKVTLCIDDATFNTVKKAAIVVKSVAGAEINVENINITDVEEDTNFAVWVDEDSKAYADKVVVNGALVKVERQTSVIASTSVILSEALSGNLDNGIVLLSENTNYGSVTVGELKDVTIIGKEGAVMTFVTVADSKIENVTLQNVNFVYDGGSNVNSGIVIHADAQIENLVVENCTFVGTGEKKGRGIYGQNPNATIVLKDCVFSNMGYPIYTMSAGGYNSLVVEGCTFSLIKSWAIMPQYGEYPGDLTVTGCTFENCTGGLVKAGSFTAGHTFTFTNNTITNSTEHPAKDWFSINTTNATKVVSNNVKDGAAWTPGAAEGLK